jgi:hypothetical protein
VLRLLVLYWLLLDCKEGVLCGVCDGTILSLDLWMLAGLFEVFDAAVLLSPHVTWLIYRGALWKART